MAGLQITAQLVEQKNSFPLSPSPPIAVDTIGGLGQLGKEVIRTYNGLCAEVNVPTTCSSCDPDLRGVIRPIPRSVSLAPTKASEQFPNRLLSVIENARKILSHLNPVSQAAQHSER